MHSAAPLTLFSALLFASAAHAQTADVAGHWEGTVQLNERVAIAVDLARGPAGAWIGTISVPGSPAVDIPLDSVVVEAGKVRFRAGLMEHPSFEGTVSADATSLAGDASSPRGSTPFELTRTGDAHVRPLAPSSTLPASLAGTWRGTITMDATPRRIVLIVERAADGTASASLYSIDKSPQEIPVTTVTLRDQELRLEVRAVGGSYRGAIAGAGISGEWSEGGVLLPLNFTHESADVEEAAMNTPARLGWYGYGYSYEYTSAASIGGWPLVHVATGRDPITLQPRVARGIVAVGSIAVGVVAIGGLACGLVTVGGASFGLLIAVGGAALGLGCSIGGLAIGSIAIGGAAFGLAYAVGDVAIAPFAIGR